MSRDNWNRRFCPNNYSNPLCSASDSDSEIDLPIKATGKARFRSNRADSNILKTEDGIDVNTVYASFKFNFQDDCLYRQEMVEEMFSRFGTVKSVRLHDNFQRKPERRKKLPGRRGPTTESSPEHTYGFISFETCEEAARCLKNKNKLASLCFIAKADSWHQDAYQKKLQCDMGCDEKKRTNDSDNDRNASIKAVSSTSSNIASTSETLDSKKPADTTNDDTEEIANEEVEPETFNILQLDDDCLMLIFDQLEIMDLISLEKTCDRFGSVVHDIYKRYKVFDFDHALTDKAFLTMLDAKTVLTEVGAFMRSLSISQKRFLRPGLRVLKLIPRCCSNLTELEIRDFTLNSITLNNLEAVFKNLEGLSLINCGISDSIEPNLSRAKNLQRLDLSLNSEITGNCLKGVKNLKYINLDSCQNIQGKPFSAFAAKNKTLEYLNINYCSRLTSEAIKSIVNNMTELSHLVCNNSYDNVEPASMVLLASLPKLKKLQLRFNRTSRPIDRILQNLVEFNQLEHLDLSDGTFTVVDYDLLCGLTQLAELKLNYRLDFTDQHLAKLGAKCNFVELHIAGCTGVSDNQLLEFIKMNPRLKLLDISYCQISEALIFSAIDILKVQAARSVAAFKRDGRRLKMMVGQTSICPVINDNNLIHNNRHLLEISFDYTDGFFDELDVDDMYDDVDDDDEDFMGYDNEEHLWGLDYDSELDMYQQFYDGDDDDDDLLPHYVFFG
ncbi:uncharacterized protein LOC129721561 isoform X2 [Wyeomyia smithii]|uniref:uncharacterized protein LOC129721561 isoform X2 n=1 Tax=Wyeomyia smithii TaxID=174621 RepID=UPI002467B54C|nr:uncharacterized protein LOC129721561 isoform X2 [Wyeomyia smithii]